MYDCVSVCDGGGGVCVCMIVSVYNGVCVCMIVLVCVMVVVVVWDRALD